MSLSVAIFLPGLGTGGAERSLSESLPGLIERGLRPTVICLHRRQEGVHGRIEALQVPVIYLAGNRVHTRVAEARRVVRNLRPALVHTTLFEANLVGRLATVGTDVPVLTSLVSPPYDLQRLPPDASRAGFRAAQAIEAVGGRLLTDHFHAISAAVKEAAMANLRVREDRITVIPRGREPVRLGLQSTSRRSSARTALGVAPGSPLIVAVGRREHVKGHRHLLAAVDVLRREFPDLLLMVVGREGGASASLDGMVERHGLGHNVRFLGHREDVPEFLAAADVFACPSLSEGLGGAVIEAMALGVPTVASDIAALREVTGGDAALLVPPGDPDALAHGLAALLTDPKRARSLGEAGRRRYLDSYTVDRMVDQTWDLYQRLAAGELTAAP
ncbi:MAG TPA: glycosyltransferase family 4 protein [Acidimicrobiales bacterium]|nr:glycosyltransferase family 4 protein [Acidimicrobiales bacterium]